MIDSNASTAEVSERKLRVIITPELTLIRTTLCTSLLCVSSKLVKPGLHFKKQGRTKIPPNQSVSTENYLKLEASLGIFLSRRLPPFLLPTGAISSPFSKKNIWLSTENL